MLANPAAQAVTSSFLPPTLVAYKPVPCPHNNPMQTVSQLTPQRKPMTSYSKENSFSNTGTSHSTTWQPHYTISQKLRRYPRQLKNPYALCIALLLTDLSDRSLVSDMSTTVNECLLGTNGTLQPIINKLKELTFDIKHSLMHISTAAGKLDTESSSNVVEKIIAAIVSCPFTNPSTAPQPTNNNGTIFPSHAATLAACVKKPVSLCYKYR